jgi:CopG family transcriptional regulator/antitoxin EndoAI
MHRRLNITLPEETIRLLDRVVRRGDRSRLIADAVEQYVEAMGRERLRKLLKEGALRRAARDREIAAEWFRQDEEAWRGGRR